MAHYSDACVCPQCCYFRKHPQLPRPVRCGDAGPASAAAYAAYAAYAADAAFKKLRASTIARAIASFEEAIALTEES
jgi:hypothetical protein